MTEQNWDDDFGRSVLVFLNGMVIPDLDPRGNRYDSGWTIAVDTAAATNPPAAEPIPDGGKLTLTARSVVVLRRTAHDGQ